MTKKSTKRKTVEEYEYSMELYSNGSSIKEISDKLEINRSTISNWVRGATGKSFTSKVKFNSRLVDTYDSIEFMRNLNPSTSDTIRFNVYSYLLGLYFGDGCIYKYPRTKRFNITLDTKYSELNDYVSKTFELLFGETPKRIYRKHSNCVDIYHSNCNLGLLFPQDGNGKKHDRPIILSEWQRNIINFRFLLIGLFHSDGCFYKRPNYNKHYYSFVNKSKDIIDLFSEGLNFHDIHHGIVEQKNGIFTINIYQDADKLKELIGTKENIVSCF